MEWVRMGLDFLSTLAWPVVAFSIAFLFRNRLDALLGRISKLSAAGVKAEFQIEQEIKKLSKTVQASPNENSSSKVDDSSSLGKSLNPSIKATDESPKSALREARELISISPTAAAALGRIALERALRDRELISNERNRPRTTMQALNLLRADLGEGLFDQSTSAIRIANMAVHGDARGLTAPLARELLDTIEVLIDKLATIKNSGLPGSETTDGS